MAFFRKVEDHIVITLDHTRLVLASIGACLFVALVFLLGVLVGKTIWSYTSEMEKRFGSQDWPKAVLQEERPKGKPLYTFYEEVKGQGNTVAEPTELKSTIVEEKQTPTAIVPVPLPVQEAPAQADPPPAQPPASAKHAEAKAKTVEAAQQEAKTEKTGELPRPSPQKAGAKELAAKAEAPAPAKVLKAEAPAPAAPPAAAAKPAPAPKGQAFSIQLEAYNEKAKAEAAAKRMSAKGISAEISSSKVGKVTWYRIHVGRYTSRDAAEKAKKELKAKGYNGMIISR